MDELLWRVSVHEAGHVIMAYLQKDTFLKSATKNLTDFGPKIIADDDILDQVVKTYLGGIAAEHVFFKQPVGGDDDLEQIMKMTSKRLDDDLDDVIDTIYNYKRQTRKVALKLYWGTKIYPQHVDKIFTESQCAIS